MKTTALFKYSRLYCASILVLLGGCSLIPEPQPVTLLQLSAPQLPAQTHDNTSASKTLRIDTPQANALEDSNRLLVVDQPNSISAYAGVRWNDTAPAMVRQQLVDWLRHEGHFKAISTERLSYSTNLVLSGELLTYQLNTLTSPPQVEIRYDALLGIPDTQQLISSRLFSINTPVQGSGISAIVDSFSKATHQLAKEITSWVNTYAK